MTQEELERININSTFRDGVDDEFWNKIEMILRDDGWELTLLPEVNGFRIDNNWTATCKADNLQEFPVFHKTFENVTDQMSQGGIVDLLADYFSSNIMNAEKIKHYTDITDRLADSYNVQVEAEDAAKGINPEISRVSSELVKADAHLGCVVGCGSFTGPMNHFNRMRSQGLAVEQAERKEKLEAYKEEHKRKGFLGLFR